MPGFQDDFDARKQEEQLRREIARATALQTDSPQRAGGFPPQVNGVSVDSNFIHTISWNEVAIGDLARYEVQVSTAASMVDAQTFIAGTNRFSYTEADEATTYYYRVRAINLAGTAGDYSVVVNGTTGEALADGAVTTPKLADSAVTTIKIGDLQVSTLKIEDQAVTIPVSAFTSGTLGSINSETTIQTASITSTGAPIAIIVSAESGIDTGTANDVTYKIKRGATTLYTSDSYDFPNNQSLPFAAAIADTPGAGTFTYTLTANETGGGGTNFAKNRSIILLETKK